MTLTLERCRQGRYGKITGERDGLSEQLVTVTVILLLLVLLSAVVSVLLQTQSQGALGQAVDFQGECGDLVKMQVSITECQSSVRLERG